MSNFEDIKVTNLPFTAFGELLTAQLSPLIQCSFEYTVTNTEIGEIEVTNSGTVTQADAMVVVSTGTTTGSEAEWETKKHAKYKAGQGGVFRGTGLFTAGVAGTEQFIGLVDDEGSSASFKNGYCVGFVGTTFSFIRFQNDVLTSIAQSAWNIDKMDGTGPSGMTLDPTKLNVYFIQFQYLGAGAINLYIEDDATGRPTLVNCELYANNNVVPSVYNPNFHLAINALNKATTSDMIVKSASMAYFIEGKTSFIEIHQPQAATGQRQKTSVTTEIAIFTIRNKSTYASKDNFLDVLLENVTAAIEATGANNLGEIRLVRDATLGGTPSYSDINTTDSIIEIDVAGTTVTNGKEIFFSPLAGKNDRIGVNLIDYKIILAPGETLTISGSSASAATINASLLWKELF